MRFQVGVKTFGEIENLIESNCWKAFVWIHILLHRQMYMIYYYGTQRKPLGYTKINLKLNEQGYASESIKLNDVGEHNEKWGILTENVRFFGTLKNLCYSSSLINKNIYKELTDYNNYRNEKIGHPNTNEHLVPDEDVKELCKNGLKIVKELDGIYLELFKNLSANEASSNNSF